MSINTNTSMEAQAAAPNPEKATANGSRKTASTSAVLHAVLFCEAFDLPVTEHGQAGKGGHHDRNAKAFVASSELVNCCALIGIAHEVDVTLHDVWVEFEGVLDD